MYFSLQLILLKLNNPIAVFTSEINMTCFREWSKHWNWRHSSFLNLITDKKNLKSTCYWCYDHDYSNTNACSANNVQIGWIINACIFFTAGKTLNILMWQNTNAAKWMWMLNIIIIKPKYGKKKFLILFLA